jgi:hypothetical protein
MFKGDKGDKGVKGDDGCCSGCQNWSTWNPDVSQVCDGENFWQNRYCLDNSGVGSGIGSGGGGSQYEWRSATGTSIPDWSPWTPDPSTVCSGIEFTQTRTDLNGICGSEYQGSIGTSIPDWSSWSPDPSTVCSGIEFTQTRTDLNGICQQNETQPSIGTAMPNWGPWTPDPSTVCSGTSFTQTRTDLNGCESNQTRSSTGSSIPNWGPWTPDPSTQPYGQSFTQTRSDLNGKCEDDTQSAIGTRVCSDVSLDVTGGLVQINHLSTGTCTRISTYTFSSFSNNTIFAPQISVISGNFPDGTPCCCNYSIPNSQYQGVGLSGYGGPGDTVVYTIRDTYGYLTGSATVTIPTTPGIYTYYIAIPLNRSDASGAFDGVIRVTVTSC